MFKYLFDIVHGTYTQLRSLVMVFSHSFRKRDTLQYPEEAVYLPPRYRGRIVLTRDPDGEERCVACNLCAVACPVVKHIGRCLWRLFALYFLITLIAMQFI